MDFNGCVFPVKYGKRFWPFLTYQYGNLLWLMDDWYGDWYHFDPPKKPKNRHISTYEWLKGNICTLHVDVCLDAGESPWVSWENPQQLTWMTGGPMAWKPRKPLSFGVVDFYIMGFQSWTNENHLQCVTVWWSSSFIAYISYILVSRKGPHCRVSLKWVMAMSRARWQIQRLHRDT